MFFRGGLDAVMIWIQQALSSEHPKDIFLRIIFSKFYCTRSYHGVLRYHGLFIRSTKLYCSAQIGARDLAFPFLNTLGFWLYVAGAILINLFFLVGGEFAATGWLAIAPLSGLEFSPGVGVDYWLMSLQISGLGTLLGGINFLVTILKMRAPGMTLSACHFLYGRLFAVWFLLFVSSLFSPRLLHYYS